MPESAVRSIQPAFVDEGARIMRVCNACRYCEGFCAVFPAMERRLAFTASDMGYLANLCHDCGECLDACQYAPPHEFGVNVPATLAAIRQHTYRGFAWPAWCAAIAGHPRAALVLTTVVVPAVFLGWLAASSGLSTLVSPHADADGAFYAVMSNRTMTAVFGVPAIFVAIALIIGFGRCWRGFSAAMARVPVEAGLQTRLGRSKDRPLPPTDLRSFGQALSDTLRLTNLAGGGHGCAYPSETPSHTRRLCHHLTFYGFMLCLASTMTAAVYHHVLGWPGPFALSSAPVVLGSLGGAGLLIGPAGFMWLEWKRRPDPNTNAHADRADHALSATLFLIALTGFFLMAFRESAAMGLLLGIHLGLVLGLFLTMPYGRFVHGLYRFCALVRNAIEGRSA